MQSKKYLLVLPVFVLLLSSVSLAQDEKVNTEENRKCGRMIKDSKDADPELFFDVLKCELSDDEAFAASNNGLQLADGDNGKNLTDQDITKSTFATDSKVRGVKIVSAFPTKPVISEDKIFPIKDIKAVPLPPILTKEVNTVANQTKAVGVEKNVSPFQP